MRGTRGIGASAVIVLAATATTACGGNVGTGSSIASGSGSGSDAGGGGSGARWGITIPASDLGDEVALQMASFTASPSGEGYKCQVFDNPFGGVNTDIVESHGVASGPLFRFFLYNMTALEASTEPAVGSVGDCVGKGLEFHPFPFFSQQPDWTVRYPVASDGSPMGYPLAGANSVMMYVHYLNLGSTTTTVSAKIMLTPAKSGVVSTHVGSLFLSPVTISVPAGTTSQSPTLVQTTWPGDPALPARYEIITSWSFMNRWGAKLTASADGNTFYTETTQNQPGLFVHASNMTEPSTASGALAPIPMTLSTPITWSCGLYNTTGMALTFGDGALTNVWCNYIGQYYPADATSPDIIGIVN